MSEKTSLRKMKASVRIDAESHPRLKKNLRAHGFHARALYARTFTESRKTRREECPIAFSRPVEIF